jgi:aerobic-type carbon monoxide dehydrogenase small subunit (CoxS/CutS family)
MTEDKKKKSGGISRREFLKDAGLVAGGAAIGSTVLLAACGGGEETTVTKTVTSTAPGTTSTKTVTTTAGEVTKTVTDTVTDTVTTTATGTGGTETITITKTVEVPGPGVPAENVISLTVNGQVYARQVAPEDTLRDLLRKKLGLTSPKDMCLEFGACGSCTVIVDGRPMISCMVLAIECGGCVVETAEGICAAKHPLFETYNTHQALQCGFCTPGFVTTAKALLDREPNPTEADIREALGGNICRCGSYPGHIPAVLAAADMLGGA